MTDDYRRARAALRVIALGDQVIAANVAARAIVGPAPRRPCLGIMSALRGLRSRLDQLTFCEHVDLSTPVPAWWTPCAPNRIACRFCHELAIVDAVGRRCQHCRRMHDRPPRRTRHLVASEESMPKLVDDHTVTTFPPVILEVQLCARCRR